jgi:hypothetical protein
MLYPRTSCHSDYWGVSHDGAPGLKRDCVTASASPIGTSVFVLILSFGLHPWMAWSRGCIFIQVV